MLGAKDGSGSATAISSFTRLEFRDGKRKRGAQNMRHAYHGSGRPHVHCLLWLENIIAIDLPTVVSATLPKDNGPLKEIVKASQQSYSGSGWAQNLEASVWHEESELLQLHHDAKDKRAGI